ncbi:MAG TPA: glycosyltransferase [Phycisphaerales bacterium]|nr:glycosyltransferase [Phycisphaerales bacterium]HMP36682.1 glycosyltransferase [Phycisphaerales bacterium]
MIGLSVVAPAHNEEENVAPLVEEIVAALDPTGIEYEIVIIDDGSTDSTPQRLAALLGRFDRLRVIRMTQTPPGRGNGQSAAFHAGFRASRGALLALLDADLQNDPADIPAMLQRLAETGADVVQGDRSANRRDSFIRRASSWVGRTARRLLLGDSIRDTGCSLRVLRRAVALSIPLEFRGMHRFIPVTARHLGHRVVEMPVRHRPRTSGNTKYGIWNRALPGLIDCFAVRWMHARRRPTAWSAVEPGARPAQDSEITAGPVEARRSTEAAKSLEAPSA